MSTGPDGRSIFSFVTFEEMYYVVCVNAFYVWGNPFDAVSFEFDDMTLLIYKRHLVFYGLNLFALCSYFDD